ncbi:MAG TPA: response regulator [Candidatus Limnocylindria bacterium]|nr:response regulator [Candidatus Limnocylindria bacterium]
MARVLIVEDDPASMDLALRIVRLEKHEPITTADGETALAVARAVRPDLVLLDLHIPKLDGWGFVKKLREEEWGKRVPVVAVSASATPPERDRALRTGCDDFLPKPYYPEQMRDMLRKHLKPRAHAGTPR